MKRCVCLCACLLLAGALLGCSSLPAGTQTEMEGLTIVVDPGHGDTDVGTIGVTSGVYEKDVNLAISLKLRAALEEKGVYVIMTRETDDPLGDPGEAKLDVRKEADMQKREEIIAGAQANLLLSIHQNSFEDPAVRGPQVFYLESNQKADGAKLAGAIQKAINEALKPDKPRSTGKGNWRLLKPGAQPGCIVECGFFSNAQDEALLQDEAHQDLLVGAIVAGVEAYVRRYGA